MSDLPLFDDSNGGEKTISQEIGRHNLELLKFSSEIQSPDYTADIGFAPALLTQLSLPYQNLAASNEIWVRRNGNLVLTVRPHLVQHLDGTVERQYPYGIIPRHLVAYLSTQATKTGERTVDLGNSLTDFMRKLNMAHTGPNAKRLRDQLQRFFGSTITIDGSLTNSSGSGTTTVYFQFATVMKLWDAAPQVLGADIAPRAPWVNSVTLSEAFFNEATTRPVPIDLNVMRMLTSPMAVDIYQWATHRMYSLKAETFVSWEELAMQFGSQYREIRQFKAQFLKRLADVIKVYPDLNIEESSKGGALGTLRMIPSRTSVPIRPKRRALGSGSAD